MESFEQLLVRLAHLRSRTAAALRDADRRRREPLRMLLGGARLRGVEELLVHLDALAADWEADANLTSLAFLPTRLGDDFETAVEATLSGYLAVAADAMRDVMEIENLLWDFSTDPTLGGALAERRPHDPAQGLQRRRWALPPVCGHGVCLRG